MTEDLLRKIGIVVGDGELLSTMENDGWTFYELRNFSDQVTHRYRVKMVLIHYLPIKYRVEYQEFAATGEQLREGWFFH